MRISCAFTSLVHHTSIRRRQASSKLLLIPSARQILSTYCVAVLSASRVRSFLGTSWSKIHTVHAFHTNLASFPNRYFQMSSTSGGSDNNDPPKPKRVLVPIADGSEEIETACITDTLTRFGAKVTVASVKATDLVCTMSRGLKIVADCTMDDAAAADPWDMIVLPGGMPGAEHLRDCPTLQTLLHDHVVVHQRPCGAICAAPAVVLASSGSLFQSLHRMGTAAATTTATCYPAPAFRSQLSDAEVVVSEEDVVVSGPIITSQGPATALAFGLQLGEILYGVEKRKEIAKAMLTV